MCRLYGFRANERTKVECSLIRAQNALLTQSRRDLRGESHPHGWGIACYEDHVPLVERRDTAAFEDLHFSTTVERTYSRTVVAHVRQATVGGPSPENTHPFVHGCWTFAHNGTVRPFEALGPRLEKEVDPVLLAERRGTTDSELAFYWLLERMRGAGIELDRPCRDLTVLAEVIGTSVHHLAHLSAAERPERPAALNFLLTDGDVLVATHWEGTLHWVERVGIHDCEVCGIPHVHHTEGRAYRAVVIASEPVSHEPWREVPHGGVLAVDREARAHLEAAGATAPPSGAHRPGR